MNIMIALYDSDGKRINMIDDEEVIGIGNNYIHDKGRGSRNGIRVHR